MDRFHTLVVLAAFALVGIRGSGQPLPIPGGDPGSQPVKAGKAKPLGGDWEVLFSDNSSMKFSLLEDQLLVQTTYGALTIPTKDIRKIEFGVRLSGDEQQRFDAALAAIGTKDAKNREEGKTQLKALGIKITPFLKTAIRKADSESLPHLEQVYETVAGDRAAREQLPRDFDTITTEESHFAGRIATSQLRINTFQFGELKLRVTDAKALQFGGLTPLIDEKLEIVDAANFYQLFQTHMGKTLGVKVTGAAAGSIWGTGTYTADSNIHIAAVHAGAVKVGESKVIKIRIVRDPGAYFGSTAHGVMSYPYGQYPTGAYEIVVK